MGLYSYMEPEILGRILRRKVILLRARKGRNGGLHASFSRGSGTDFLQHREYASGDDIKSIDWRLSARRDHFFVREYESETAITAAFLLDGSSSMDYASDFTPDVDTHTKFEYGKRLISHLALFFLNQRDRIELAMLHAGRRGWARRQNNPVNSNQVVEQLQHWKPGENISLKQSLQFMQRRFDDQRVLFLFSDFIDPLFLGEEPPRLFLPRSGRVILVRINDNAEVEFPFRRYRRFYNPETERRVLLDPRKVHSQYTEAFARQTDLLVRYCKKFGASFISVKTSDMLELSLEKILNAAEGR